MITQHDYEVRGSGRECVWKEYSAGARALEPTHTRPRLEANWVHTFAPSTCYPPAL